MSYRFTRYQPKYREEIVRLQSVLWGPDLALNAAYLTWKYEQNPYLDEPLIWRTSASSACAGATARNGKSAEAGKLSSCRARVTRRSLRNIAIVDSCANCCGLCRTTKP